MLPNKLRNFAVFFHSSAEKGLLLIISCLAAVILANSAGAGWYFHLLHSPIMQFGEHAISVEKIVLDGFMVLFFLLVGLEIKREAIEGNLATKQQRILPMVAAIGGVLGPIGIYWLMNHHDADAVYGWAVPSATDIAFALGMFALLGKGLPIQLRVFLTALAVVDDLIAVILIALFYTAKLSYTHLIMMVCLVMVMYFLCKQKYVRLWVYLILGAVLWYTTLCSGIHATVAGVLVGLLIPLWNKGGNYSPLYKMERVLHPWVMFVILPLFAFVSSGVTIKSVGVELLNHTVSMGIILGLVIGKPLGIMASLALCKFLRVVQQTGFTVWQFFAVSVLCGVGFTMSLFVGNLAFATHPDLLDEMKVGVLCGSLISALLGAMVIRIIPKH
jgi:NhaA family Na+:H+ antiporter